MKILFVRHGKTFGNIKKQYIGATDESLIQEGIDYILNKTKPLVNEVISQAVAKKEKIMLVSSPMIRCTQTAKLLFEDNEEILSTLVLNVKLKECNFGEFERKNYMDLSGNEVYQAFIDSGGKIAFPGGESREEFEKRCVEGFMEIVSKYKDVDLMVMVVHGGTIMSIMDYYHEDKDYYDFQIQNGEILVFEYGEK